MGQVRLQDILNYYGIHITKFTKTGGKIHCPFHEDKTPSCNVDLNKNVFYCFPCGEGGGIIKFVMMKEHTNRDGAYDVLRKRFNVKFHRNYQENVEVNKQSREEYQIQQFNWGIAYCKQNGIKIDGEILLGILGFATYEYYWQKEQEKRYWLGTKWGKKEHMLRYLQIEKCQPLLNKVRKTVKLRKEKNRMLSKLHRAKEVEAFFEEADEEFWGYKEKLQMVEALEEQITIRMMNGFKAIRNEDVDLFKDLKDSWFELYAVLWDMAEAGRNWMMFISEVDWMKP